MIALASTEAGAVAPMQSSVAPPPTRSRWRDLPVTPTPTATAERSQWRQMPATPEPVVTVIVRLLDQHERHPNATTR